MNYQAFWTNTSFAIVGNSLKMSFPKISYTELKKQGKKVYPIDLGAETVEGEQVFKDLTEISEDIDAAILEIPKDQTLQWIEKAAEKGIKSIWIHMGCESPEAIALAKEKDINLFYGTCAAMYLVPGLSYHSIHKWINKIIGKY